MFKVINSWFFAVVINKKFNSWKENKHEQCSIKFSCLVFMMQNKKYFFRHNFDHKAALGRFFQPSHNQLFWSSVSYLPLWVTSGFHEVDIIIAHIVNQLSHRFSLLSDFDDSESLLKLYDTKSKWSDAFELRWRTSQCNVSNIFSQPSDEMHH